MAVAVGSGLKQWADSVLQLVGVPVNPTNEDTLYRWARAESGGDPLRWNNPLNTTENWPGSVPVNAVGVKSYPDLDTGARATAATLTNGYYPDILSSLQNSLPTAQWGANARAQITKWGTNLAFLGGSGAAAAASQFSSSLSSGGSVLAFGPRVGQIGYQGNASGPNIGVPNPWDILNAAQSIPTAILGAGGAIGSGIGSSITGAEQSITKKIIALFEVGIGGALLLAGGIILVVLVARTDGGQAVTGAVGRGVRTVGNFTPQGRAVNVVRSAAPKAAPKAAPAPATREIRAGGREIKVTNPESRARLRAAGYEAA